MFECIQNEGIRLAIRRKYVAFTKKYRKRKLISQDFTIISNNCWGGIVYQSYDIQYQSPFIGLFIMPDHYLRLLSNFEYYMSLPLEFISPEDSTYNKYENKSTLFGQYPIGILDRDVEIHFLHYHSEEEALEKWNKRKERMNWNRMLFKFNDQNECTEEQIIEFLDLKLKHKICFTKNFKGKGATQIKGIKHSSFVPTSFEPIGASRFININEVLNNL